MASDGHLVLEGWQPHSSQFFFLTTKLFLKTNIQFSAKSGHVQDGAGDVEHQPALTRWTTLVDSCSRDMEAVLFVAMPFSNASWNVASASDLDNVEMGEPKFKKF
ncbi:hypothetical protein HELRODRAFT_160437 [Helobdella robusta]|uniref:Uncharacterized protein n=1 Tax=Helobdella robusta TaxID=6412 RepID=T1EQ90_HELRO|nr:hypothetical protein HELRODRAFT_160437 [Helobdella robusta]ESO06276.1 hypothetical protein HELRODRAFT_160437 [Helobdella robusta]